MNDTSKTVTLLRTLTVGQLIILGLAYMQPLVVLDTFGIVSDKTNGHVSGAYVVATICLALTAFSYGKLAAKYPDAGSAYTYIKQTIGNRCGFMVGWSSLVDYLLMPMVNIIQAKAYLAAIFPSIPSWEFVVGITVLITFFNVVGIRVIANINTMIVGLQLFILAVFVLLMMDFIWSNPPLRPDVIGLHPEWPLLSSSADSFLTIRPFVSNEIEILPLMAGAGLLCFSFLGFDSISTFAEEAEDPKVTIPRSIALTVFVAGVIFVTISFLTQIIFPNGFPFSDPENSSQPDIILYVAGRFFQALMLGFSAFSVFAGGLVAQTGVSRLIYVMGRDDFFPKKFFGYVHPKFRTPVFNILLVGVICLFAIFLSLELIAEVISFGALMAFTCVNIAVIVQFYFREKQRQGWKNVVNYLIFPGLGALSIIGLWSQLSKEALIFGVIWASVGLLYLLVLTKVSNRSLAIEEHESYGEVLDETVEALGEALVEAEEGIFPTETLEEIFDVDEVVEGLKKATEENDEYQEDEVNPEDTPPSSSTLK